MSEIGDILAQNLKQRRKDLGWTQDDLAEKAELGIDTIRKLETNATWIGKETIEKLGRAFRCSQADLFLDLSRPPEARPKDVLRLVADALGVSLPKGAIEKAIVSPASATHGRIAQLLFKGDDKAEQLAMGRLEGDERRRLLVHLLMTTEREEVLRLAENTIGEFLPPRTAGKRKNLGNGG